MAEQFHDSSNVVSFSAGRPGLKSGAGGGTFDGMEPRVKVLEYRADQSEKRMERIDNKLDRALEGIARIEGRINAMPTTWQLVGLILAVLGASFAIIRFGMAGL